MDNRHEETRKMNQFVTGAVLLAGALVVNTGTAQDVIRHSQSGNRQYQTLAPQVVSDGLDTLNAQVALMQDTVEHLLQVQAYQAISISTGALQITGESIMEDLIVMDAASVGGNLTVTGDLQVTGTTSGITAAMVGLSNADNTSDADKPVSTATQAALALKAPLASPAFTGTVTGITATMVGLGNADNTSDADKPVSTAAQAALDLKASLASPAFTGTVTGITATMVGLGNVDNTSDVDKPVSTAAQTALDLKAPLASPAFTGTVTGITAGMVGLSNADNTSDADKPVSTATQTALDLKAPLASPAFTGTVTGISAAMVGLGNADNTSDADKPVSTATQTALDLKAPLASPTFTGTPSLPTGTTAVTQSASDNSTKLATTEYVDAAIAGAGSATQDILQEFTVAADGETTFQLSQLPASTTVVRMYRNGILLSATCYAVTSTDVVYDETFNGNAEMKTGDRIQFYYAY